jgi:type I restriction enzyme S subunit
MRDGWSEQTLDEVTTIINGGTPSTKHEGYWGGEIVWITTTELTAFDGKRVNSSRRTITQDGLISGPARMVRAGTTLVGTTATIGTCAMAACDLTFNQQISGLIPRTNNLDDAFLFYLIQYTKPIIEGLAAGTSFKRISTSVLKTIPINYPPLPEQKRIIDLLSSVDSYIEALRQQLENAKNSKSAYVNAIVSEIFYRGQKTKIAAIADVKGGKRLPKGTPWSEEPTDHRYIRATDIKDGIILTENLVYVPDDVWPVISRYVVNQGDVVITIAGTIGQVGVIPASLDGVNLTENAAKIVVNKTLVRSSYLCVLLGSTYYQQDIDSKTKKTTQPKLGLNMINSIEIPLPDLAEQDEIFSVVSQMDTLIANTHDLITKTNTLRTGLLSDLLSGQHEIPASYDKVMGAA